MCPSVDRLLAIQLLDLRRLIDAHLRCLTKLEKVIQAFPAKSPQARTRDKAATIKDLQDLLRDSQTVRNIAREALKLVERLEVD